VGLVGGEEGVDLLSVRWPLRSVVSGTREGGGRRGRQKGKEKNISLIVVKPIIQRVKDASAKKDQGKKGIGRFFWGKYAFLTSD